MPSDADGVPTPGFVAKLTDKDGMRHYVNICSSQFIERPLTPDDKEVGDAHLRTRGVDNLRVPLLSGVPRTVLLPGGEEAICVDIMFNPAVLYVAGADADADDDEVADSGKPKIKKGVGKDGDVDPDLAKFVRIRIIELALKNAEEELGYKIGRNYTLPRGVSYRGGIGGGKMPVPCTNLKRLAAAVAHEKKAKATQAAPGPWRSKRDAAGLANSSRIEELPDVNAKEKPLIKKGFLNSSKCEIYPNGSEEGMLYGDVKVAGDPLGYIPKGLRSRVNVVDTATTDEAAQKKIMQDYADGKGVPKVNKAKDLGGGGGYGNGNNSSSNGGGSGVNKGFLNGSKGSGSLYPNGSSEGSAGAGASDGKPSEMEMLKQMIPNQSEMDKIAAETDPEEFMAELAQFGSLLGAEGFGASSDAMLPEYVKKAQAAQAQENPLRSNYAASAKAEDVGPMQGPSAKPPATSAAASQQPPVDVMDDETQRAIAALYGDDKEAEAKPEYTVEESDGAVTLKVQLPELSALGDTQVDVSSERFVLHAPGLYKLDLPWPVSGGASDEAKAKFAKKSRTLTVTMPLVV